MTELDTRALRDAFGSFMTGVCVVTTRDANGQLFGFTANSFSSVSLNPPLLLVCPGKFLSAYESFAASTRFGVSILTEGQEDVSNTFASLKGDRFSQVDYHLDADGVPLIEGAVAQFSCSTHQVVDAGDHCVLLGQVTGFTHSESRGLGYARGRYFSLGLERSVQETGGKQVICGAIIETPGYVWLEKTETGYRPPRIVRVTRASLREDLTADLAERGTPVRLGAAYSVFDSASAHSVYILAEALAPNTRDLDAIAVEALADLIYTTQPIAVMMLRFAAEASTRDFSLFLGDAEHGETHSQAERT